MAQSGKRLMTAFDPKETLARSYGSQDWCGYPTG